MTTLRRPPRWIRKKPPKPGTPGGEYIFTWNNRQYVLPGRFIQDETSPSDDKLRWVGTAESNKVIRQLAHAIANGQCQVKESRICWKWAPLDRGHPHHVIHKKMGGAYADDRIWLTSSGQVEQIRVWSCPNCHKDHHGKLAWSKGSAA